jgi:predicted RNase H-related nuclease YkuK (DUF458 family)
VVLVRELIALGRRKMPLTKKGKKIMTAMKKQYGSKTGEKVFYATKNKGKIKNVEKKSRPKSRNRKKA